MKFSLLLLLVPFGLFANWSGQCCQQDNTCDDEECPCHNYSGRHCLFQELPTDNARLRDEAYWPTKNQDPLIDALTK